MAGESFVFEQFDATVAPPAATPGVDPAQDAAEIRSRARDEGFEQGYREGLEMGRLEGGEAAGALLRAHDQLAGAAADQTEQLERQAIELALRLAEKIVGAVIEIEPERVLDSIRGSLRRLAERTNVIVLVNPDDLELVRDALESIRIELGAIERLEAQSERRVARGGAVLRTAVGEIDASLDGQLQRAREICERELAAPRAESNSE